MKPSLPVTSLLCQGREDLREAGWQFSAVGTTASSSAETQCCSVPQTLFYMSCCLNL